MYRLTLDTDFFHIYTTDNWLQIVSRGKDLVMMMVTPTRATLTATLRKARKNRHRRKGLWRGATGIQTRNRMTTVATVMKGAVLINSVKNRNLIPIS